MRSKPPSSEKTAPGCISIETPASALLNIKSSAITKAANVRQSSKSGRDGNLLYDKHGKPSRQYVRGFVGARSL